jgi:aminopeptidase C
MSTPWFKRHVYQIVIDKKYCDKKILDSLKSKPTLVKMWDPFGNLLIR